MLTGLICNDVPYDNCWLGTTLLEIKGDDLVLMALSGFIVFILGSLIAYWIQRYPDLARHHILHNATAPYAAQPIERTVRLNPYDVQKTLNLKQLEAANKTDLAKAINEKIGTQWYIVEFRESGKQKLRLPLKIEAWHRRIEEGEFRTDPKTQAELKRRSDSLIDDDTNDTVGVDGEFDLFFRRVRYWDIRFWLFHPQREIRLAIYVAMFAAVLEYSADLIDLIRALT